MFVDLKRVINDPILFTFGLSCIQLETLCCKLAAACNKKIFQNSQQVQENYRTSFLTLENEAIASFFRLGTVSLKIAKKYLAQKISIPHSPFHAAGWIDLHVILDKLMKWHKFAAHRSE